MTAVAAALLTQAEGQGGAEREPASLVWVWGCLCRYGYESRQGCKDWGKHAHFSLRGEEEAAVCTGTIDTT